MPQAVVFENQAHQQGLAASLYQCLQRGQLVDAAILVGKTEIPCHRLVLSACSQYFNAMFSHSMKEGEARRVCLRDVRPQDVNTLIQYAYTGKAEICDENVQSLLEASDMFGMFPIRDACLEYLQDCMEPSNCLGMQLYAEKFHFDRLYQRAVQFSTENFAQVCQEEEFLQLDKNHLVLYLSQDLHVENEVKVYEGIIRWLTHDPSGGRAAFLPDLLACLRVLYLPEYYVERVVAVQPDIANCQRSINLLREVTTFCRELLSSKQLAMVSDASSRPRHYCQVLVVWGSLLQDRDKNYSHSLQCCRLAGEAEADPLPGPGPGRSLPLPSPPLAPYEQLQSVVTVGTNMVLAMSNLGTLALYHPGFRAWLSLPRLAELHCGGQLVSCQTSVYYMGGLGLNGVQSAAVERFDFAAGGAGAWMSVAPLPHPSAKLITVVCRGKIYAIGGSISKCELTRVQCYDPDADLWTSVAPWPVGTLNEFYLYSSRVATVAASIEGDIYTVSSLPDCSAVFRYDVERDAWSRVADLSIPKQKFWVCVHQSALYAVDSNQCGSEVNKVERYSVADDKWEVVGQVQLGLADGGLTTILYPFS